ncbi:DUF255 domain-containing protein [Streptomyces sp. NPDC056373]|uniref:DUF255 domain-containing protein n=1 Tax=Streptomyces sp. NPDC056373 TaxID=3345798 RepID=UPI0035D8F2D9
MPTSVLGARREREGATINVCPPVRRSPTSFSTPTTPVDWWPWSSEAFEEARKRNALVLLGVGYSSWGRRRRSRAFRGPALPLRTT